MQDEGGCFERESLIAVRLVKAKDERIDAIVGLRDAALQIVEVVATRRDPTDLVSSLQYRQGLLGGPGPSSQISSPAFSRDGCDCGLRNESVLLQL